ncbi:hypothetical protein SAMD00019534_020460 [Acytostelium subglobosum LB1]|uniref:hypothetical protein n=1 Tax=Acytostelium subglobosum LB1 TaxID=1410327 RepID=UPI0006447D6B|nr:hypothetical protein SAMD00019534_020460 [Acytostelium subglobosum LB1]GAM18871.1 hypothetical protein SAMD00019534_020460 [Acytostelium subglobosum LB1]|eukprot:XP_012758091.1 hypothetical protein SAMD00019534_020460 [Acytostelium subglobosum LB1]
MNTSPAPTSIPTATPTTVTAPATPATATTTSTPTSTKQHHPARTHSQPHHRGGAGGGGGGAGGLQRPQQQSNRPKQNKERGGGGGGGGGGGTPHKHKQQQASTGRPSDARPVVQDVSHDKEFDAELELAVALSKVEFENQQQQQNQQQPHQLQQQQQKKSKKTQVDMTHLIYTKKDKPTASYYKDYGSGSGSGHSGQRHHNNNNSGYRSSPSSNKKKAFDNSAQRSNLFLQANYLFKVNAYGNYRSSLSNPDYIACWNRIEQVEYLTKSSEFVCPICFEPPVAGKVTKCGHIACYGCILRSLYHSSNCPLCLKPIDRTDLRSVHISKATKYVENDPIELQLLRYREGTTVPYLAQQPIPSLISFPDVGHANSVFSRFSIIHDIGPITKLEKEELERAKIMAHREGEEETVRYLSRAEREIEERETAFKKMSEQKSMEHGHSSSSLSIPTSSMSTSPGEHSLESDASTVGSPDSLKLAQEYFYNQLMNNQQDDDAANTYTSTTSTTTTSTTTSTTSSNNQSNNHSNNNNKHVPHDVNDKFSYNSPPNEGYHYYYQSIDGQPIFMHPLCMQILSRDAYLRSLQQLEPGVTPTPPSLPDVLKSRVLEMESFEITKKSRHVYKALNILALTSEISFVEIDLQSIVLRQALDDFAGELKHRRDIRNNKKREETRKEKKKERDRAIDIKRSKEITEIYERQMAEERERKRIEMEIAEREEAERLKNQPAQPKAPSFLDAITKYKSHEEDFKFTLKESTSSRKRQ